MPQPVFMARPPLPPRRFTRRTWTLISLLVLLQAGLVGVIVYLVNTANRQAEEEKAEADRRLQEAEAETDRLDPQWRLHQLLARRPVLRDDANSALVVTAAKKLIPLRWPTWESPLPGRNHDFAEEARRLFQESFEQLEPAEQLNDRQITALRAEVNRAAAALAEARKLADLPQGYFSVVYKRDWYSTPFPHIQDARAVANLLGHDVWLRAQDQDMDGALTSCRAMVNCSRSMGHEPSTIAQLVHLACQALALERLQRVLAQGQAGEASLAALQRLLEKEGAVPLLLIAARGERAGSNQLMQYLETSDPETIAKFTDQVMGFRNKEREQKISRYSPLEIRIQRAVLLRYMTRVVEVAKLPISRQQRRLARLEAGVKHQPELVRLLAPAMVKLAQAFSRRQAQLRCAIAGVAVERYRLAHQDRWPDSLKALVPRYLEKVPTDPFDDAPLRVRRTGDGLVIYSVGPSGQNRGDGIHRGEPEGAGKDLNFRLWDVAKRRQPAKPFRPNLLMPPHGFPPGHLPPPGGDR